MKTVVALLWFLNTCLLAVGSDAAFPLWPDGAPGALGKEAKDIPTLTPYVPQTNRTGAAMVICPGGAYGHLADHEGRAYAEWLKDHGVTAFVLRYRLGSEGYRHPAMLQDAARAVRTVRARASEWNVDPAKIGIMGSSAGGHLAATLLTHFDNGDTNSADVVERRSSRPDLGILCYPVISMGPLSHSGSRQNLLGPAPDPELVRELSNELHVSSATPPCFIWHTMDDTVVQVENSVMFAHALRSAGVPVELHLIEKGAHGLGLGIREYTPERAQQLLPWTGDCLYWLKQRGFAR